MTDEIEIANKAGRPSKADLDARTAALAEKEAALEAREQEVALKVAETNAAMRETEVIRAEADVSRVSAARSGSARSGEARSETITEPLRRRRYHGGEIPNEFHVPPEQIPDGISYQWNNYTVFGMQNPSYDSHMLMQGWRPVDASRHPHLVPEGHTGPIIVKGQVLMERPMELTQEALEEDYQRAIGEVRRKEEQLYGTPPGTLPRARANGTNEFNKVIRTVEPGQPIKPNYQYVDTGGPPVDP